MLIFRSRSVAKGGPAKENRGQKIGSSELELLKLEKDFFIAEYNSLRQEILQRIAQLTLFSQITLTAFAALVGIGLKDTNYPQIILLYPILSLFLSFSYGFNNSRIFEIARYLQCREREIEGMGLGSMYWESYVNEDFSERSSKGERKSRIRPGIFIFMGTQSVSMLLWLSTLLRTPEIEAGRDQVLLGRNRAADGEWLIFSLLILADLVSLVWTYRNITGVDKRRHRKEMNELTTTLVERRRRRREYIDRVYGGS